MNDNELELRLGRWLAEGPTSAPLRLARDAGAFALAHPRVRRSWRDVLVAPGVLVRPMPLVMRPVIMLMLLALAFALGAFFYAASHQAPIVIPQPTPTVEPSPTATATATPAPTSVPLACTPGANPGDPGPIAQQRPQLGLLTSAATGRIFATTGYEATAQSIWKFDSCGNSWYQTGIQLDASPSLVLYEPQFDDLLLVGGHVPAERPWVDNAISRVDLAGRVTFLPWISTGHVPVGAVYRSFTGQTVAIDGGALLWAWDENADDWMGLVQTGDAPPIDANVWGAAYDESTDRMIVYAVGEWQRTGGTVWPPRTYEFDFSSSTWLRGGDPPDVTYGGWGYAARMAYDPVQARTVLLVDHAVAGYDSTRHIWESLLTGDSGQAASQVVLELAYDALNQRVVAGANDGAMWAVDLQSKKWVLLLAPAEQ